MRKRHGFTLVELVVVVMILGLLAAIAAPKFLSMSDTTQDNDAKHNLALIRDAVELYVAQHETFPAATGTQDEAQLKADLKDYFRGGFPEVPVGPLAGTASADTVAVITGETALDGDASPTAAWKYHVDTGEIIVNFNGEVTTDPGTYYDEF